MSILDVEAELPGRADEDLGHVYVLQYENGAVKIGITTHPARRVLDHDTYANIFQRKRTLCWVSPAHYWYRLHEFVLIARALEVCKSEAIGEWFPGLDVGPVIAVAERLDYQTRSDYGGYGSLYGGTPPPGPLGRLPVAVRSLLSERAQNVLRVGLSYPPGTSPSLDVVRRDTWDRCGDASVFMKSINELKQSGHYAERLLGFPAPDSRSQHRGVVIRAFSPRPRDAVRALQAPLSQLAREHVSARVCPAV